MLVHPARPEPRPDRPEADALPARDASDAPLAAHAPNSPNAANTANAPNTPKASTSQPFEQLMAGLMAGPGVVADTLASPALGRAWARAIVMHWSRVQRQGGIDLQQTLMVLDLAPAGAQLLGVLLPPLAAELRAHGMHEWPVRYLACTATRQEQAQLEERLAQEPALRHHLRSGLLSVAHWPAQTGQPMLIGSARAPLFGARNPVVCVALGGWSHQASRLHAVHHGRLLRGYMQLLPSADTDEADSLTARYEWRDAEVSDVAAVGEAVLLQRYCTGLPSAPLLLSEPALTQIDALADFSGGRYLLLCADAGVTSERQIRGQALAPPPRVRPGRCLMPVNFHALSHHQHMNGARVSLQQRSDDGWVLHWASRDDPLGVDEQTWQHLGHVLMQAHPDDRTPAALHAEQPADAAVLEGLLRRSAGDVRVLGEVMSAVQGADLYSDPTSAEALLGALEQAWAQLLAAQRDLPKALAVAELAARLDGWALARAVLEQAAPQSAAEKAAWCRLRAVVERDTGHAGQAMQWALRAVQADAADGAARELLGSLRERAARWLHHPWVVQERMRDGPLCLEPLEESHQAALRYQLRDPLIAEMAQMPPLEQIQRDDSVDYALMHSVHGFVGVIGFRHYADMGYFHLWIGADHQGRGLGSRALGLLLQLLHASGLPHLFTAVFEDNLRCRKVLQRAGFLELPPLESSATVDYLFAYRATAPEPDQPLPLAQLKQRLIALDQALD